MHTRFEAGGGRTASALSSSIYESEAVNGRGVLSPPDPAGFFSEGSEDLVIEPHIEGSLTIRTTQQVLKGYNHSIPDSGPDAK